MNDSTSTSETIGGVTPDAPPRAGSLLDSRALAAHASVVHSSATQAKPAQTGEPDRWEARTIAIGREMVLRRDCFGDRSRGFDVPHSPTSRHR